VLPFWNAELRGVHAEFRRVDTEFQISLN
jgi:hypothetical protein